MTTLLAILQSAGVFMLGLAVRLLVGLLLLAALVLPILLAYRAVVWLHGLYRRRLGVSELGGLPWRSGLLHTGGHLWMKPGRAGMRVGIDGLAQRLLPGVERVSLPAVGASVRRGDPIAEVVTRTRRVPIPAPMDAVVAHVNHRLLRDPARLERDPYIAGWLVTLRPQKPERERQLCLEGNGAREWFRSESRWLARLLEQELGVASADGGGSLAGLERSLTKDQWERLTEAFLNAA